MPTIRIPSDERLLAPIYRNAAALRAYPGPLESRRYAYVVNTGLFQWSPNSTATDDGTTVIGVSGGANGRWLILDAVGVSALDPEPVGDVADPGSVGQASDAGHVHADNPATLGRIAALEADVAITVITANGALGYGLQVVTGGTTFTLPALSAASGKAKPITVIWEIDTDATVSSVGSNPIVLDDNGEGTSVNVPAGTRTVTFVDRTTKWSPSVGLLAP